MAPEKIKFDGHEFSEKRTEQNVSPKKGSHHRVLGKRRKLLHRQLGVVRPVNGGRQNWYHSRKEPSGGGARGTVPPFFDPYLRGRVKLLIPRPRGHDATKVGACGGPVEARRACRARDVLQVIEYLPCLCHMNLF